MSIPVLGKLVSIEQDWLDQIGNKLLSSNAKRTYIRGRRRNTEFAQAGMGDGRKAKVQLELKRTITTKGMLTTTLAVKEQMRKI